MRSSIIYLVAAFLILIVAISVGSAAPSYKGSAIQMTSTLENSNTQPQYNYAENIGDGRGITFGCIGFCTGTYDGNILIKHYTTLNPGNSLAKYIPALNAIDVGSHNSAGGEGNPSTAGLSGFIPAVQNCNDPLFKQAQIDMLDKLYWNPAMSLADSIGAKYPLTRAFIYDMCVRHGADGAKSIISKAGATPAQGTDEKVYLSRLISARDSALRSEGLGDISRDKGFSALLSSGNVNLVTPYTFVAYGDSFTINGKIGTDFTTSEPEIVISENTTVISENPVVVSHDNHKHKKIFHKHKKVTRMWCR